MRWVSLACLLAFVLPAQAATVREWSEAYSRPELAGAGIDATGQTITAGSLALSMSGGVLHPVLVAGRVAGLYFHGPGRFRYVSHDPFESACYRHNVREATGYEVDDGNAVSDEFRSVLVTSSEPLTGMALEGEPPEGSRQAFRSHVERFREDRGVRYVQLMPHAMVDPPESPLVCVEIQGKRHDLVYQRDPLRTSRESLAVVAERKGALAFRKGRRYPTNLSVQPIAGSRLDPPPMRFQLADVDVAVTNREGRMAEIVARETFEAHRPLKALDLALTSSVAGTVGISGRWEELFCRLEEVRDIQGRELPWTHSRGDLVVELPEPLAPGEHIKIVFRFGGDFLFRPARNNYWRLRGSWYPSPTRWAMEGFRYRAVVKTPESWLAFSQGRATRRWKEGELACTEFLDLGVVTGATILAGRYTTYTDEREDLVVRVSSYAMTDERASRRIAEMVHGFVEFYQKLLGDFPWPELDVVELETLGYSQAPAGIVFVGREALSPSEDLYANLFVSGINRRIAHEVAHAWWGHVARLSDAEDQWLSESTAEYYSAVALASLGREEDFHRAVREWKSMANEVGDRGSIYMGNLVTGGGFETHRKNLLYGKGPLMLHAMRQKIRNDEVFFTILKSLITTFHRKPLWTRDFVGLTNHVTGEDWTPWFDRYLFGTETPEVE